MRLRDDHHQAVIDVRRKLLIAGNEIIDMETIIWQTPHGLEIDLADGFESRQHHQIDGKQINNRKCDQDDIEKDVKQCPAGHSSVSVRMF